MSQKNRFKKILEERSFANFPTLVRDNAELYGDCPVYSYYEGKTILQISYKEFYNNILALGTTFNKLGLSGKTVAVIGTAHPAYMTTYHATVWSGGIIVPMDKEISDEEVVNFLKLSDNAHTILDRVIGNKFHFGCFTKTKSFTNLATDKTCCTCKGLRSSLSNLHALNCADVHLNVG